MTDEHDEEKGDPGDRLLSPKIQDSGLGLEAEGSTTTEERQTQQVAELATETDVSEHVADGGEATDGQQPEDPVQPAMTDDEIPDPHDCDNKDETEDGTETGTEHAEGVAETEQVQGSDADDQAQEASREIRERSSGEEEDSSPPSPRIDTDPDRQADETDDPAQSLAPSRTNSWAHEFDHLRPDTPEWLTTPWIDELDHLEPNSPISRRASWIGEFDHLRPFPTTKSREKPETTEEAEAEPEPEPEPDPADIDDDSPSRLEWLRQRAVEGEKKNTGLDRMMCMVGLETIKAMFLSMKAAVEASIRRGEALHGNLINLSEVTGGPGTGKLQVNNHFKTFKDELYDWPLDDVDVYKSHYSSRVAHIDDYSDADIHEFLRRLFKKRGLEPEGGVGGFYTDLFAKKIGKGRLMKGFRNVWAIRDAFTAACDRQADRLQSERFLRQKNGEEGDPPDDKFLTKEDMLGKPPPDIRETSAAYKELQTMAGMDKVKKAVEELMDRAKVNYRLEMRGKRPIHTHLNRVILGPPGTGKTTLAALLGRIIVDLGLVSKKEVVNKDPSDFRPVWATVVLDEAVGKVLIIDDAHTLADNEKWSEVTDTIVAKTSTKPGQDRVIILVGYPEQMHKMFREGNPGLRSRFPLEDAFETGDYELPALMHIFDQKLEEEELETTEVARGVASQVLARSKDIPNFGNGRDVESLVNRARSSYIQRTARERDAARPEAAQTNGTVALTNETNGTRGSVPELKVSILDGADGITAEPDDLAVTNGISTHPPEEDDDDESAGDELPQAEEPPPASAAAPVDLYELDERIVLEPEDFDPDWQLADGAGANCKALFAEFVGFELVVKQFEGYQQVVAGMRLHGRDPRPNIPFTFVFKGPPGTGKTSTARKVGQIFYDMRFLASPEVVECSATDLIGKYLGHTGPKVQALMEKGLGKVLFIDEAYRLGSGLTGTSGGSLEDEAVGELVDSLTKPRYMRKMVIILAGYSEDMDVLMKSNRGLRGRFATEVVFPQLTPSQCLLYLGQLVGQMDIAIRDLQAPSLEEKSKVQRLLGKLAATRDWSNGRDVETLSRKIIGDVFMREGRRRRKSPRLQVSTRELIGFLQDMLRERLSGELPDRE